MSNAVLKRKKQSDGYETLEMVNAVTTVGRSKSCDITVNDTSISRLHFRVENRNGRYFLVDNNSSNGTFLNRRKVTESILKDGDQIITGRVHFVFSQAQDEEGGETRPLELLGEAKVTSTVSMRADEFPAQPKLPFDGGTTDIHGDETIGTPMAPPDSNQTSPVPPAPSPPPPEVPSAPTLPKMKPTGREPAPPVKRLLALIIDSLLIFVAMLPSIILAVLGANTLSTLVGLVLWLAIMAHPVVGWAKYGKTLGKHWMGIRIIELESPASPGLSIRCLLLRFVGYLLSGFTFYLLFLTVLFDDEGRGFHDKIAGTQVIIDS